MERSQLKSRQAGWRLAGLRMQVALLRLATTFKAGFRPDQPRVPRGNPDGGQWTHGSGAVLQVSRQRAGGGQIRIGGQWQQITPAQQARLALSQSAMRDAIRDVRKVDPNWKPPAQAYSTAEGLISANQAVANEARRRIFELARTGAETGPFAREWVTAPATNRRLNQAEQREIDRIGRKWGCHRCGNKNPGTNTGRFIGDHQVPKSIGTSTRIYPHCIWCSLRQGGLLSQYLRRGAK